MALTRAWRLPIEGPVFGLLVVASLALTLRFGLLLAGVNAEGNRYEHGEIAENLLAGRGFSVRFLGVEGPTSQQAPLYPMLIAAADVLFGPRWSQIAVGSLQCVAGTVTAMLVVGLGWSLFPDRRAVGWLAGLIAAAFPSQVYLATQIQVVVWATLLLTAIVALACRSSRGGGWWQAAGLGLLAGLLLLVEPILALALPIVALAAWQRDYRAHQLRWCSTGPVVRVLVMAGVAGMVIAPWLGRNYRVHGEFVFVKSTFGYAFWQGNNEISWGTDKVPKANAERIRATHDGTLAGMNRALWEARHETIYIDDVLLSPGKYQEFQGLSEPQRSRLLADRAWRQISRDPQRYARLCGQRLRYFLLFDETNPKAANRLYRVTTVTWLVLVVLGLLVTRGQWRVLWPTLAIFVMVALFHTLTITSARFRMPLEPLTFVWIAAGLAPLGSRWWQRIATGLERMHRFASLSAKSAPSGDHGDSNDDGTAPPASVVPPAHLTFEEPSAPSRAASGLVRRH